jgi:hypothetical protein
VILQEESKNKLCWRKLEGLDDITDIEDLLIQCMKGWVISSGTLVYRFFHVLLFLLNLMDVTGKKNGTQIFTKDLQPRFCVQRLGR